MATAYDYVLVTLFRKEPHTAYCYLCDVLTDVFRDALTKLYVYTVEHVHGPGSTMVTEPDGKVDTYISIFLNETEEEMRAIVQGDRLIIPVLIGVESADEGGTGLSEAYPVYLPSETTLQELAQQAVAVWLFRKDALIEKLRGEMLRREKPDPTVYFLRVLSHKSIKHPHFDPVKGYAQLAKDQVPVTCKALDALAKLFYALGEDTQNAAGRVHDWTHDGVGIVHQYFIHDQLDWRRFADCLFHLPDVYEVTVYKGPDYGDEDIIYKRSRP